MINNDPQQPSIREKKEMSSFDRDPKPSAKEHQLGVRIEGAPEPETLEANQESERSKENVEQKDVRTTESESKEGIAQAPVSGQPGSIGQIKPVKTEMRKDVERILSEDISELYAQMTDEQKKKFREEGEEVSSKVEKILEGVKVKAREILVLIRNWLGKIPGINRFFLIQAAKIKTDKILALKKRR